MSSKLRLTAVLALIVSMFSVTMSASAFHDGTNQYHPIERDEFEEVWERTDRPVAETVVARTWIWGPAGFSDLITEEYEEGDDGTREVQYFDKSRMEMPTDGDADTEDSDSPWFITQGLLASELMTGRLQLGDDEFEQHHPSHRSAAGDPQDETAPTYEAMGDLMDRDAREGENVIVEYADRDGEVTTDADRFADYGVTDVEGDWQDVEGIDKNIASVFWDFMNSESTVYEDGEYVQDDLFLNAFYAVGYPLTDAFWADVMVDGEVQDVLIQCFERRCLTYTPGNSEGWQVESGNIGQHYYNWRYEQIDREAPTAGSFSFNGEQTANVEFGGDIVLNAHVTAHGDDAEGASVYFQIIGGDEDAVSLNPDNAETGADGTADVTVTGESEGTAEVQAFVDLNDNGTYELETDLGLGVVEVTVGPALPDLSVDLSALEDAEPGAIVEVTGNVSNPDEADGGADWDSARFDVVVDGPVDCDANGVAEWEDWFEIIDVNDSGNDQGFNATFECDEDSGNFTGHWGPEAGFLLSAGDDVNTTFDIEVAADAPLGVYAQTVTLVDVDTSSVLATASGEFEIVAADLS